MLGFNWIVRDVLAGSPQPGLYGDWEEDIEHLKKHNITHIVSLTERPLVEEGLTAEGFEFEHFPIRDMNIPMPRNAFELISKMVENVNNGKKYLIHCKGGVGRTGMIGACYLVAKGLPADEAIVQVRLVHRPYIQTKIQESFIGHFEEYYRENSKK
ncbi:MAG: dual specificity protein phosphatase family protein [Cyclobacteriaceae bacterium]